IGVGAVTLDRLNTTAVPGFKSIDNPSPQSQNYFGTSVAPAGPDHVLVGSLGGVVLMDLNGGIVRAFPDPVPGSNDCFGASVSLVGSDKILVGAPQHNGGQGCAYLFDLDGNLLRTFTRPDPITSGGFFGGAVAGLGADKVIIGGSGDSYSIAGGG